MEAQLEPLGEQVRNIAICSGRDGRGRRASAQQCQVVRVNPSGPPEITFGLRL